MVQDKFTENTQRLLPVLVYIQAHLDEDLSLERVAAKVDLSPFHFHRIFRETLGETLKQYTQRLRLERAAYHLIVRGDSILEVALSAGFNAHETFSRTFKSKFGLTPSAHRKTNHHKSLLESERATRLLNHHTKNYEISRVTVQHLNAIPVAFIRNLGPYANVDVSFYDRLIGWATRKGIYHGSNLLIGIGHDAPNITPPEKLRYDACIQVPHEIKPDGQIGFQSTPAGDYAAISYIGPYGPTMEQAYFDMFAQMMELEGYTIIGLPVIEIYQTTRINQDYDLNHTDIYIPVEKQP